MQKVAQLQDRRALLFGAGLATIGALTPGDAALAAAEPARAGIPGLEFVYEALITLQPATPVGATPFGKRNRVPIAGGTFTGPRIAGKVLAGGMDWQLIREDGFTVIEADYMMQASDGALIHVYNKGLFGAGADGVLYRRTTPWFEAPNGPHAWMNQAVFVGTLGSAPPEAGAAVKIEVFKVV